jgi:hypothetical protein
MNDRKEYDSAGRAPMYGASTAGQDAQVTQRQPGVGKMSRVQAEMGQPRAKAGSVKPAQVPEPSQPEPLQGFTPTGSLALGPENERRTAADVGAAQHGLAQQVASTAPGQATPSQPAPPTLALEVEYEDKKTNLKLRAKVMRRDGVTSRATQKAAGNIEGYPIDAKAKEAELKVVLSQKGAALQETLATAEVGIVAFEGMRVSIKLAAFEGKLPLDYSLLKLTFEGTATDVAWFANTSLAGEFRVDVALSWSTAIDKKLLAKIVQELAAFEKAGQKVAALTKEVEEATRKLEAAKKARDAARVEQALAKKAESAATKARNLATKTERAAAQAERTAVTAEARAAAQAERAAARAARAAAHAEVEAAQVARRAAAKVVSLEEKALAHNAQMLKALAPKLKSATVEMAEATGKLRGFLSKQIGARVGKVLATKAGQALLKAVPIIGTVMLAKDIYDVASWMIALPWEGGRFFGQDGSGSGDAGVAANPGSVDAPVDAPPAPDGGVDPDGGDADRGVDGAGTTGTDSTGSPLPTAKPATPAAPAAPAAPAPQAPTAAPQAPTPRPAPMTQIPAPTPSQSNGQGGRATQDAGQAKQGNGGSGSGSATPTVEPVQPTKVPATGSSAPSGDTASKQTAPNEITGTPGDAGHGNADRGEHDVHDDVDHAPSNDQVVDQSGAQSGDQRTGAAAPAPQQTKAKPTLAQANELKRKAKAKAARKAKAAAEAEKRQRAANELADRRLFWGGDQQILAALHWDGATLTKKIDVLNAYITQMQQHPQTASNGAQVALRRMQVTIGKPMGTQVPVEVKYLAEQQQGAQWVPCAQDAQSMLFDTLVDIPSKRLSQAGDLHAELFGGGVLQVKNGNVVAARKTFTIAGAGTFEVVGKIKTTDKGDHWKVTVTLMPLDILNRKIKFHVDGGQWVELGSSVAKDRGLTMTLKHSKTAS